MEAIERLHRLGASVTARLECGLTPLRIALWSAMTAANPDGTPMTLARERARARARRFVELAGEDMAREERVVQAVVARVPPELRVYWSKYIPHLLETRLVEVVEAELGIRSVAPDVGDAQRRLTHRDNRSNLSVCRCVSPYATAQRSSWWASRTLGRRALCDACVGDNGWGHTRSRHERRCWRRRRGIVAVCG